MKSFQGHSVKWAEIGSSWNSSLGPSSSWMIVKLIRWCFLPKGNLRLILLSLRSHWWPQISQSKLTSALFLRTNEKKHTVVSVGERKVSLGLNRPNSCKLIKRHYRFTHQMYQSFYIINKFVYFVLLLFLTSHFWLRQEPKVSRCRACVCPSVRPSVTFLK